MTTIIMWQQYRRFASQEADFLVKNRFQLLPAPFEYTFSQELSICRVHHVVERSFQELLIKGREFIDGVVVKRQHSECLQVLIKSIGHRLPPDPPPAVGVLPDLFREVGLDLVEAFTSHPGTGQDDEVRGI